MTSEVLSLGDDFESLLRSRLQSHQQQLDRHRGNVSHKIEWLIPQFPNHTQGVSENEIAHVQKPRHAQAPSTTPAKERPTLSEKTERLAAKRKAEYGVECLPIEESLILRGDMSKAEKWLRAQHVLESETPAKPTITPRASAMPSSSIDETTARLYQPSVANERVLLSLKTQLEKLVADNVEHTFRPAITPRAERLTRRTAHTAHEDLYAQAMARNEYKKAVEAQRMEQQRNERRSRTPRVNPLSALIAERLPESTQERLTRNPPKRREEPKQEPAPRAHSSARTRALYEDHTIRQARLLMMASGRDDLPEECSFTPTINKAPPLGQPLIERLSNWDLRRAQKAEAHRLEREGASLTECTFTPITNKGPKYADAYEAHPGTHEFVSRQQTKVRKDALSASPQRVNAPNPGNAPHTAADHEVLQKAMDALHRARSATKRVTATEMGTL